MDISNVTLEEIPEPLRIIKDNFVLDIFYYQKQLTFNFFGNSKAWRKWDSKKIDELFTETFGAPIKDMTGEYERLVKDSIKTNDANNRVKEISFSDAYKSIKNDPAKIQKNFIEQLPLYEPGKDWDASKHLQTWSYVIKEPNLPFIDLQAKKIVEGVEEILS